MIEWIEFEFCFSFVCFIFLLNTSVRPSFTYYYTPNLVVVKIIIIPHPILLVPQNSMGRQRSEEAAVCR